MSGTTGTEHPGMVAARKHAAADSGPTPDDDPYTPHEAPYDDATPPTKPPDDDARDGDGKQPRRSVAAQLVDLARSTYSVTVDGQGDAYGIDQARPHIALPLRGGRTGLRAELARRYFDEHNTVPAAQALADACTVLEGIAAQADPVRVHLRVAQHNGAVYIDIGDTKHRVIAITGGQWTVTETAPVLFRRTKLTGPLPVPASGDLSNLWRFVPVDKADRPVLLAWLVAALIQPDVAHTVLALLAEQGAAKSTITRFLVSLVDPSPVAVRQAPRDADKWVTAAAASWVVGLDNLSGVIPAWLSDSLCRACTGDGDVRRALYTDNDVALIAFRRVVVFNGIDVQVTAGDLAERLVAIDLARITNRLTDEAVTTAWDQARPGIFGALLNLAADVHHLLLGIKVKDLPRMADYAKVLAAVDQIQGTTGLARYRERSAQVAAETIVNPFIVAMRSVNYSATDKTAAEVLADLTTTDTVRGWPRNARSATNQLTRNAPALRLQGWVVQHDAGHNHDKIRRWKIQPPEKPGIPDPPDPPDPHGSPELQKRDTSAAGQPAGQHSRLTRADPPDPQKQHDDNALTRQCELAGQAGQEYTPSLISSSDTPPLCPVCQRAPARTDSRMCDFCTVKRNRQQTHDEAAS